MIGRRTTLVACLALALALGGLAPLHAQDDWSSHRADAAMTGVASSKLPARLELLWSHNTQSPVLSSAAIVGRSVYITQRNGTVSSLNLADGKPRWSVKLDGDITASPLVTGGRVFIGTAQGTFYALKADSGRTDWSAQTGAKITSSATPAGDAVLAGSYDNKLYCLEQATGKPRWTFEADAQVHCSPCVAGGKVYIAGCDGQLRFIELATGKQTDSLDFEVNFAANCVRRNNTLVAVSLEGLLLIVDADKAKVLHQRKRDGRNQAQVFAAPAVTKDLIVYSPATRDLIALTLADARPKWTWRAGDIIDAPPTVVGDRVFVGADDGRLTELSLANGRPVWSTALGGAIKGAPAVGRNILVVGTEDGAVYAFGERKP